MSLIVNISVYSSFVLLWMVKLVGTKTMVSLSILSALVIFGVSDFMFYSHCQMDDAVTITGYFTPVEVEYAAEPTVRIETESGRREYRKDFWDDLLIEWVGISEHDGVVSIWSYGSDRKPNVYTDLAMPMDALGGLLTTFTAGKIFTPGTAASNHLEPGTVVRVIEQPLAPLWTQPLYHVTDTIGGPNDEKHIDLYMGEGLAAKERANAVTKLSGTGTICIYGK